MSSLEDKTKTPFDQLPNELLQQQRHLEKIEKKHKKQHLQNDYNKNADSFEGYSRVFNK
jgi:hypothetical protein